MKKDRTPMTPQVYTVSMSTREAEARTEAAKDFKDIHFEVIGKEGDLVVGQTVVTDFKSLKRFNKRPGVLPPRRQD